MVHTMEKSEACIGANIRKIRQAKGVKQEDLLHMLHQCDVKISRDELVKIEAGQQDITGAQLKGIRDCLNTSFDELLQL
ncbi:MAG TPA: helix-turn-helix transcriptional regulator [Firmicutes bacterium]|nr:helix-turn-helix transcriptional regulator [Bacillota bacterium]